MNLADEQEMPALELVKSEPTPDAVPPLLIEQTSAVQVPAANCISTSIHSPTQVVMTSRGKFFLFLPALQFPPSPDWASRLP